MSLEYNAISESLAELIKSKFPSSSDSSSLNLDSLQLMELAAEIEDKYNISIPMEEVGGIRTIHDAAELIQKLQNGGS